MKLMMPPNFGSIRSTPKIVIENNIFKELMYKSLALM